VSVRVGIDLEPGIHLSRTLPDLDLLDVAYGAVHGGAQIIMLPVIAVIAATAYTPAMFKRPGLPLLALKVEIMDVDRVPALGNDPDRIFITGESGQSVADTGYAGEQAARVIRSGQEVGVLCEPEAAPLKELARAKAHWAYFSTARAYQAQNAEECQMEIAQLQSAAVAANRLHLRVALFGPTGRHLPAVLSQVPHVEEIYPVPDLWSLALRLGWEQAVSEYQHWLR